MNIKQIVVIVLTFFSITLNAQQSITIATDPLTIPVLNGFEVEVGFNTNKSRVTASYLSGNLPPWYGQAADFNSTSHSVFELAYNRFINDEQKGFNYGLAFAYFTKFRVEDSQGNFLEKNPSKLALKIAYAWYPFKSFPLYLEPGLSFGLFLNDEALNFPSGEVFNKKQFIGNGPLFNIGYKFEL